MKYLAIVLTLAIGGFAVAQDIRQTIPLPLPMTMGGSGGVTGAVALSSTVGALPACNAAIKGQIYFVTDALLPALGAIIAGGGAVNALVFCNGTNWIRG